MHNAKCASPERAGEEQRFGWLLSTAPCAKQQRMRTEADEARLLVNPPAQKPENRIETQARSAFAAFPAASQAGASGDLPRAKTLKNGRIHST